MMDQNGLLDAWVYSVGKEAIQEFQDDFSSLNNVSLRLLRLDGSPITVTSRGSLFCSFIKGQNQSRCETQHQAILDRVAATKAPVVDSCYAGLTCFACPILHNREAIGAFFGGMVISDDAGLTSEPNRVASDTEPMSHTDLKKIVALLNSTIALLKNVRSMTNNTIDETGNTLMKEFGLSSREIMVVDQIVHNRSNRDIAEALFISEKTVKTHVTNILKKTSTRNRYELVSTCKRYFNA